MYAPRQIWIFGQKEIKPMQKKLVKLVKEFGFDTQELTEDQ